MSELLSVEDLTVKFGDFVATRSVGFSVAAGTTVGLVGESGSGKSTIARAVAGLVPVHTGTLRFKGIALKGLAPRTGQHSGQPIQMVFQNPDAALNPRLTIARLIEEPLMTAGLRDRRARGDRVLSLLDQVGLPAQVQTRQPHQLSGGQKQRVCIARALAAEPELLIADEAVSALDVSVQGQILNLLNDLRRDRNLSQLFISHNLSVVRHVADQVVVLFHGHLLEEADQASLWAAPAHPYTQALIAAVPVTDPAQARERRQILRSMPAADAPPAASGCVYRSRCARAEAICSSAIPELRSIGPGRRVACHFPAVHRDQPGATIAASG